VCYSIVLLGRETGSLQLLAPLLLTGGKGADLVIRGDVVLNTLSARSTSTLLRDRRSASTLRQTGRSSGLAELSYATGFWFIYAIKWYVFCSSRSVRIIGRAIIARYRGATPEVALAYRRSPRALLEPRSRRKSHRAGGHPCDGVRPTDQLWDQASVCGLRPSARTHVQRPSPCMAAPANCWLTLVAERQPGGRGNGAVAIDGVSISTKPSGIFPLPKETNRPLFFFLVGPSENCVPRI
jgi:hypothetical protein